MKRMEKKVEKNGSLLRTQVSSFTLVITEHSIHSSRRQEYNSCLLSSVLQSSIYLGLPQAEQSKKLKEELEVPLAVRNYRQENKNQDWCSVHSSQFNHLEIYFLSLRLSKSQLSNRLHWSEDKSQKNTNYNLLLVMEVCVLQKRTPVHFIIRNHLSLQTQKSVTNTRS